MIPDMDAWQAWHPAQVADRLAGVRTPWYVAAGWAIDLHRGGAPREHEDLEIAVPEAGFAEIAGRFPELAFHVAGGGRLVPAVPAALPTHHQTWALDPVAGVWRFDVFREPHGGDVWICRRDARLRRPYAEIVRRSPQGIPYLAPDVVLLFKARHARPKDERDYAAMLPLLSADERAWLAGALGLVHPGHAWLAGLS